MGRLRPLTFCPHRTHAPPFWRSRHTLTIYRHGRPKRAGRRERVTRACSTCPQVPNRCQQRKEE